MCLLMFIKGVWESFAQWVIPSKGHLGQPLNLAFASVKIQFMSCLSLVQCCNVDPILTDPSL